MGTAREHLQTLYDLVAELQGQTIANSTMIEALLMSHPDSAALRDCWTRLSSPRLADAALDGATKNRAADRAEIFHLAMWREKLERRVG